MDCEMDSSDWSNGIRYHTFDTRPDAELKQWGPLRHIRSTGQPRCARSANLTHAPSMHSKSSYVKVKVASTLPIAAGSQVT